MLAQMWLIFWKTKSEPKKYFGYGQKMAMLQGIPAKWQIVRAGCVEGEQ